MKWKDESVADLIAYFGQKIKLPKLDKIVSIIWRDLGVEKAEVKFVIEGEESEFKILNVAKSKANDFEEAFQKGYVDILKFIKSEDSLASEDL